MASIDKPNPSQADRRGDLLPPEKLEELQTLCWVVALVLLQMMATSSRLVAGENRFFFHVSSKRSSEVTDLLGSQELYSRH